MDRNGKLVTRHVRASSNLVTKMAMPAPAVHVPSSRFGIPRSFAMSRFAHESSMLIHPAANMGRMHFEFEACDHEVYDVMSVVSNGNAFVLLELGIRSSDEALSYLRTMDAEELIQDNSSLVQEMVDRGIPADKFARAYENIRPSMKAASKYIADGIELITNDVMRQSSSIESVTDDVLDGRIKLGDLKSLGYPRIYDRIYFLRGPLMRYAAEEATFSLDEMRSVLQRTEMENITGAKFGNAVELFEKLGADNFSKLKDIESLIVCYKDSSTNARERHEEMDRAFYQAQLMEGLDDPDSPRPATYWALKFPAETNQLRQAGIPVEEAITHMKNGYSAQETIGILSGIESSISGGWL